MSKKASDKQISYLIDLGVREKRANNLNMDQARKMISKLARIRKYYEKEEVN